MAGVFGCQQWEAYKRRVLLIHFTKTIGMKNIFSKIIITVCCGAMLGLTACQKNIADEVTELNFSRLFSPTGVQAIVVNKTGVRLAWNKVNKAETYTFEFFSNGNLDFTGTPVRTVTGVLGSQSPFTVSGLAGETNYSVRIKAVGVGIEDSKWSSATFKTDAEQIFYAVDPADIQAKQVTLKWPAGQTATSIVLTPDNITHTVTPAEIVAGAAVITGLTPEVSYTAKLMNGASTRGTVTFNTLIDLGGAIQVKPTDDLTTILQNANSGDVFALMPGVYNTQDIIISKSIAIKGARPADKPVLTGTIFRIIANAGLQLKDLIMDGTGSLNANQAIIYDEDQTNAYAPFKMEDCIVRNYTKGLFYVNKKTWIQSVLFSGNIIYNIECNGGDFIDFRNGLATTVDFVKNTVYNSALARDFFRMDPGGSTNFPAVKSIITINSNTLYNVSNGSSRRVLYIRLAQHEIIFNKNIIAATDGYYTNQSSTTIKEMSKNNYYNAPNFTASVVAGSKNDTGDYTQLNPGFASTTTGNFTVSDINLKAAGIGDPRWL